MKALAVWVAALVLAPAAAASTPLGDLAVHDLRLQVNANGKALLTYRREDGRIRNVLVWGAINARPPSTEAPQVAFHFDYSGGLASLGHYAAPRFVNRCAPYDGPQLCRSSSPRARRPTAPTGRCRHGGGSSRCADSHRGSRTKNKLEFHVSHWSGPLAAARRVAELDVRRPLAGAVRAVSRTAAARCSGTSTPSATKRGDGYARYVYIDAHDSMYGPGWRHDAGKVLHLGNGAFCYSFVPQVPPRRLSGAVHRAAPRSAMLTA